MTGQKHNWQNYRLTYQLSYADDDQKPYINELIALIGKRQLSIDFALNKLDKKPSQKQQANLAADNTPNLWLDKHNKLTWLSAQGEVTPNWEKLQKRVVTAGRKSELLLQAAKITSSSKVLDATAGFGHDALILASSGACVTLLEKLPMMALLLIAEQFRMSHEKNWQKLMARLQIYGMDLQAFYQSQDKNQDQSQTSFDVVYLDPMFPEDSYLDSKSGRGAQVNKRMQALHHIALPPTLSEEAELLTCAKSLVNNSDKTRRVIVKRPKQAPFLAKITPDDSWQNDAVRFDAYFV